MKISLHEIGGEKFWSLDSQLHQDVVEVFKKKATEDGEEYIHFENRPLRLIVSVMRNHGRSDLAQKIQDMCK